jgi:hypothetical protein
LRGIRSSSLVGTSVTESRGGPPSVEASAPAVSRSWRVWPAVRIRVGAEGCGAYDPGSTGAAVTVGRVTTDAADELVPTGADRGEPPTVE